MSRCSPNQQALHERLLAAYNKRGKLRFYDFMQMALYSPDLGYYAKKDRPRVGKTEQHDFSTATQLGALWGKLLKEAILNLLSPLDPAEYTLIELGVEPDGSPLSRMETRPFKGMETRELGEPLELPEKSVLFFNEVLDAQAFHRIRYTKEGWKEAGVCPDPQEESTWTWEWLSPSEELLSFAKSIENPLPGQTLDLPLGANQWLEALLDLPWQGLLLTVDYGKTWHELIHEFPEGTGRAFSKQKVHNDLLRTPGEQDLTCDPCWDWLEAILHKKRGTQIQRRRLEAFWMEHAQPTLESIFLKGNMQERSILKELLHPTFYGMRFEALSAKID